MITINGKSFENTQELTILEYLNISGYNTQRIAVELNGKILPKKFYDTTKLCDGDKIEIVNFVGGG